MDSQEGTEPLGVPAAVLSQLELPEISVPVSPCNVDAHHLVKLHHLMYHRIGFKSGKCILKQASKDIQAIRLAFPAVQSPEVILAMAAWLALLCMVDDEVEPLGEENAQTALASSISLLQDSSGGPWRQHAFQSMHSHHHGGSAGRVTTVTESFILQTACLLPRRVYGKLVSGITKVWQAMIQERQYGDHYTPDVPTYLNIRLRTIGLNPFFLLLQHELGVNVVHDHTTRTVLRQLQAHTSLAVGMQNDIGGLRKDISTGESFNFVVVASKADALVLVVALKRAIGSHNAAVQGAEAAHQELIDQDADECVVEYARSLLAFLQRHLAWVSSSKRYAL